jgi:tripartite-type tricarboxylate transporter receptor subunit TctC
MTKKMSRRRLLLSSAAAMPFATLRAFAALPDPLQRRPITWVLPFPPGGFGDALSRMLAQHMSVTLRTPVVVDNRPGASGQIAAAYVKQMPADGHTLFNGDMGSFSMNAALYRKLKYDTLKDFAPVTRLVTSSLMLVVPSASPFMTFDDLVKGAKIAKADARVIYGSFGVGSLSHVWVELLQREIKGQFQHVAYKGSKEALQDLMAGRTDMMLDLVANSLPHVQAGKLRVLAVMGDDRRLEGLPQAPTLTELGYPTLNASGWNGVVVRAGTPIDAIDQLHSAVTKAVQSEEVSRQFRHLGISPAPLSPSEFARFIDTETARWGSVIRRANVVLG